MSKQQFNDPVDVIVAYDPKDRSRQGKRVTMERDVARMNVRDGLVRYAPPAPDVDAEPEVVESPDAKPATKRTNATAKD
jgi:hypothetical protein